MLGLASQSTHRQWKNDHETVLPYETLGRLSFILGIFKTLQILLPGRSAADAWIKRPNSAPLFKGRSALDLMLSGQEDDLRLIRSNLDSQLNGRVRLPKQTLDD